MNLNISLASTFVPHKVEIYLPSPCISNVGVLSTIYTLASHHTQVNVICRVYNRALSFMAVAHPVLLDSVVVPPFPKSAQRFPTVLSHSEACFVTTACHAQTYERDMRETC